MCNHIIDVAATRKDCIACISPTESTVMLDRSSGNSDNTISFYNDVRKSNYAFADSNYKYISDKYNNKFRYVPFNADTAGLMVRSAADRDPWFSPAGFNRGVYKGVVKTMVEQTKSNRDSLYKSAINPVVNFAGQGTVLFGDKTFTMKPSAFDRINVRRLFIVLEKSIATSAKFTLFEFNDEFTRAQFTSLIEPFLRDIKGRRGIYDFKVVCDSTNNTPNVIDSNQFVGDIFIQPARSINFIQLNFVAVRTGVSFDEIVGVV
jgi:phage tail sheath protein FI